MNFIYDGNKFNVDNTMALKRKTMDFKLFIFCCCTFQLISAQLQLCDSFEVMYYLVHLLLAFNFLLSIKNINNTSII